MRCFYQINDYEDLSNILDVVGISLWKWLVIIILSSLEYKEILDLYKSNLTSKSPNPKEFYNIKNLKLKEKVYQNEQDNQRDILFHKIFEKNAYVKEKVAN